MKKTFLIITLVLIGFVLFSTYLLFGPTIKNPGNKALYIPRKAGLQQVKDSLRINGVVTNFAIFNLMASKAGLETHIKPGKYRITQHMSIYSLVRHLRKGDQVGVNLVITKIRTKEDLAKRISRVLETDSSDAMTFLNSNDSLLAFNVDTNTVLTDVFPDTYTYFWTADMRTIFNKLYTEQKKFWNEDRIRQAGSHGLSPSEVYILASVVEEETNKQEDKGKIASVYINRIRKGMPLAADPTIKYAMKNFSLTRIYHKYLDVESPYNTYRNKGLPPGPICTPSKKTIQAVLEAPETDYLYFVAKPELNGFSNFATSYQEHLVYAKAYQKALDSLGENRVSNK